MIKGLFAHFDVNAPVFKTRVMYEITGRQFVALVRHYYAKPHYIFPIAVRAGVPSAEVHWTVTQPDAVVRNELETYANTRHTPTPIPLHLLQGLAMMGVIPFGQYVLVAE